MALENKINDTVVQAGTIKKLKKKSVVVNIKGGAQQQVSDTPKEIRDLWQTPLYLFNAMNEKFHFTIDLAANKDNHLCPRYIDGESRNSLEADWLVESQGGYGWCNPPYSQLKLWFKKAWDEAQRGAKTVMLVPTPNGENGYRDYVFGKCSKIIMINGRISFIAAADFTVKGKKGKPDKFVKKGDQSSGNTRGSCYLIFDKKTVGDLQIMEWLNRDELKFLHG